MESARSAAITAVKQELDLVRDRLNSVFLSVDQQIIGRSVTIDSLVWFTLVDDPLPPQVWQWIAAQVWEDIANQAGEDIDGSE